MEVLKSSKKTKHMKTYIKRLKNSKKSRNLKKNEKTAKST